MISGKLTSKEKSKNESSMGNLICKNLVCNWCHKKWHIRAGCWTHKKKQQEANTTELAEGNGDKCDVFSVTDSLIVIKIDGLLTLDVHNISILIEKCSLHILR